MQPEDSDSGQPVPIVSAYRRGRRWPWLVLSAVVVVAMGCVCAVGGVLWWGTARASQAGGGPSAAVRAVIGSLEQFSDDLGGRVIVYLCDEDEDELLAQLGAVRDALVGSGTSYRLELANFRETPTGEGVTVTVDVSIAVSAGGGGLSSHSARVRWTFDTENDRSLFSASKGWKVCAMQTPGVCETFVRCG